MNKRMLRSALATVIFSAVAGLGLAAAALGGAGGAADVQAEDSGWREPSADSGWREAPLDSGWRSNPADADSAALVVESTV
ncbi:MULTISPECIES: hypothetical protein [unclassified Streptomyces]|uniref:hypothetical protein n=1 Tax=unclassified Streptomyces TaxID=2593676 RepID=UPI0033D690EA